jgi:hypothetical protein
MSNPRLWSSPEARAALLEKVRRLIALVASPNEAEARNAAIHAIRLIEADCVILIRPPTFHAYTLTRADNTARDIANVADAVAYAAKLVSDSLKPAKAKKRKRVSPFPKYPKRT